MTPTGTFKIRRQNQLNSKWNPNRFCSCCSNNYQEIDNEKKKKIIGLISVKGDFSTANISGSISQLNAYTLFPPAIVWKNQIEQKFTKQKS